MEPLKMNTARITDDTICAISTPPGVGGIAVIRISGPEAISIVQKIWSGTSLLEAKSHTAHFGRILTPNGHMLDEGVATLFREPHSFTGEDTVEISIHGSTYIQQQLINALIDSGARMANAGEFTQRAFRNGRFDLAQAEAVADIIAADSAAAHRLAMQQMRGTFSAKINNLHDSLLQLAALLELELDFSEEDVEFADRSRLISLAQEINDYVTSLASSFATGRAIREGIPVAIVGEPNAGKSTLLNLLAGHDRAIVSDIPGTTRDTVEETVNISGTNFRLIDTAGLRQTDDTIERFGIERSAKAIANASIVLWLIDSTAEPDNVDRTWSEIEPALGSASYSKLILLINKIDLSSTAAIEALPATRRALEHIGSRAVEVMPHSSHRPSTTDALRERLAEVVNSRIAQSDVIVTNARHYEALSKASKSITRVIDALQSGIPEDLIAQDIRETLNHLASITGTITTPDLLSHIFSHFCIGK